MRWPQIPLFPTKIVSPGSSMFAIAASIPAGLPTESSRSSAGQSQTTSTFAWHKTPPLLGYSRPVHLAAMWCRSVLYRPGWSWRHVLPACPVPLMRQTYFDFVWNIYRRPSWISSMIARKGGCRWPAKVQWCYHARGCTALHLVLRCCVEAGQQKVPLFGTHPWLLWDLLHLPHQLRCIRRTSRIRKAPNKGRLCAASTLG